LEDAEWLAERFEALISPDWRKSRPESASSGYDRAPIARSMHALMDRIGVHHTEVVGHDIGLMVAYAYAAQYPEEVTRLALT
jgi:pimeloyl-ACP methyl ester carboxylesterase